MTEPFRMLILGDFGARDHRGGSDASSLDARRPRRVDRDDLDAVIAAFAPELHLALEPGAAPVVVRVTELEDFHPDHLVERVADFQRLRELRAQVADPRNAPTSRPAEPVRRGPSAESTAANLSGGSVLDMILGDADAPNATAAPRPRDELSDYVSQAVRKHAAPERSPDQETLIKNVDDVIAATMRVVLHHPRFQAAEALWRGVSFLIRRLDTDEACRIYVVDVTKSELVAAAASGDASGRALRKLLRSETGPGPWSLVLGAYSFGPDEISTIASVAALAREVGVPWISAASARFAGIASFAESADPDDWDASPLPEWDAFRRTADARWIALALPRVLLRVPYGAGSDECSAIRFEETDDGQLPHDHYLWGNGAFLCAALFGMAAADESDPPTHGTVDGLPIYIGKVDGLAAVTPGAEAVFAQRAVTRLLDRGLTALACEREGDSVRVPRVQSVASPPAPLAPPQRER